MPIAESMDGSLAAKELIPKALKEIAVSHEYIGGFSKKGLPFSFGTMKSLSRYICAAIPETLASVDLVNGVVLIPENRSADTNSMNPAQTAK